MRNTNVHSAQGRQITYYLAGAHGVNVDVSRGTITLTGGATWSSSAPGATSDVFEPVAVNPFPWATSPRSTDLLANLRARGGLSGLMPGELPAGTYKVTLSGSKNPSLSRTLRIEVTAAGEARVDVGSHRHTRGHMVPVTLIMKGAACHAGWDDEGRSFESRHAQMAPQANRLGLNMLSADYRATHFLTITPVVDPGCISLECTLSGVDGVTHSGRFAPVPV